MVTGSGRHPTQPYQLSPRTRLISVHFCCSASAHKELTLAYDSTIEGWVKALELRNQEKEGHTQRMTEMTLQLCQAFHLDEKQCI